MKFFIQNNYSHRIGDESFAEAEARNHIDGPPVTCELCGSYLSSLSWSHPRKVKFNSFDIGDFTFGSDVMPFICSDKTVTIFQREGIKGPIFTPLDEIQVKRFKGSLIEMPKYHSVDLTYWGAKLHPSSKVIREFEGELCECLSSLIVRIDSIKVDLATWNGDDVFYLSGIPNTVIYKNDLLIW